MNLIEVQIGETRVPVRIPQTMLTMRPGDTERPARSVAAFLVGRIADELIEGFDRLLTAYSPAARAKFAAQLQAELIAKFTDEVQAAVERTQAVERAREAAE